MTTPDTHRRITGRRFIEALREAGIIHHGDYVRRVVIDADLNAACMVYLERFGDERLIDVVIGSGLEITKTPHPEAPKEPTP